MRIIEATRRSGVAIAPDKTVRAAAQTMEQAGVGALAIIDGERVVGIVTDRDLVRRALSPGLPFDTRIDTVMTTPVVTVDADADLGEVVALFRAHKVRRLAVVQNEKFVGMITIDDLLIDVIALLPDLLRPVRSEIFTSSARHCDTSNGLTAEIGSPGHQIET
jgi:CBS domain-containing protein